MPPPDARLAIAVQLHQGRDYAGAERAYRHVLTVHPNHPEGLRLLGQLFHETGRHEEAVDALRRGIATATEATELRRTIIGPLVALNELDEAITHAQAVVRRQPNAPEGHVVLAQLLARGGDHAGAAGPARRAVDLGPNNAVAWLVLARSMANTGHPADALVAFDRAVAIAPAFVDAAVERAFLLQNHGRLEQAADGYARALQHAPEHLVALNNAGLCFAGLNQPMQAAHYFERAARLAPGDSRPRSNVGGALKEAGRYDDALPQLVAATRLDPTNPSPVSNIGACYAALGDHPRAIEAYRSAEQLDPAFDAAGSNLLLSLISMDDVPAATVLAEHVAWGHRHAGRVVAATPRITDPRPDRRLRVAYLSPDFRDHSVRQFIEPVLIAHDRSAVEVVCYACGRRRDAATARLTKLPDQWHDVAHLDAAETADLIRSHHIDVLVDLAGHTAENRLLTLARRPAPVQATYLGYPATTGLAAVDYRLTDAIADPPGADEQYTEQLVRLPDAFFVYTDDDAVPYEPVLPADRNGFVTFGAFNSYTKVTQDALATWAAIMAMVPRSRLVMKGKSLENPSTRAAVSAVFAAVGVGPDRLELRGWAPVAEHVKLLSTVDLMLDTFPYNGHTTTCQSLWNGAAVLTRHGPTDFRGRVGLSILTQLGLPEFAVDTADAYARRAVELASDLSHLRDLRPSWRDRMKRSPLCDAPRFTRGLEAAYRQMWAAACETAGPRTGLDIA
jgi:protein O-GlcNAc transferase